MLTLERSEGSEHIFLMSEEQILTYLFFEKFLARFHFYARHKRRIDSTILSINLTGKLKSFISLSKNIKNVLARWL